jgi:hypothetical protein
MRNKKFKKKDLIELLVKKATGFYYNEEQFEYEKVSNKSKSDENLDISKICKKNIKKAVTLSGKSECWGGNIELSNEINSKMLAMDNKDLILTKKKVSTHYIPPDMVAIKILFENFEKKVDSNDIEKLNNEELINLKNKLLEELKNETDNN